MKKILLIALALISSLCSAQTFTVNNLAVNGTSGHTGQATFTLSPTMPTPTAGDSSTKGATTAFVATSFATLASPAFTGVPTAPTAGVGTNTTQIATTAFVAAHDPCPSIMDYGGDNTGTNNNDTALANTIAANPTSQICVYEPPGTYKFGGAINYSLPNANAAITIKGAGADATINYWPAGGGLEINFAGPNNSAHIRDLSLTTGTTNAGNALDMSMTPTTVTNPGNSALSDITNVTIRGNDGYSVTDYWQNGIAVNAVSNINFIGLDIYGPTGAGYVSSGLGVILTGGNANRFPVIYNFTDCLFNYLNQGIYINAYVQGVSVFQSNFVGGAYGIYVPVGLTQLAELSVSGSQFNEGNVDIYEGTVIPQTMIINNTFYSRANANSIQLADAGFFAISGNTFSAITNTNNNAIVIGTTEASWPGVISNNIFVGYGAAVVLQAASRSVNVQSNAYLNNTTNISNSGIGNTLGGGSQ